MQRASGASTVTSARRRLLFGTLFALTVLVPGKSATAAEGVPAKRPHFLAPKEILERMKDSPVHYEIVAGSTQKVPVSEFGAVLWPAARPRIDRPVVEKDASGKPSVHAFSIGRKAADALERAEKLFGWRRYAEAAEGYERAVVLEPTCYVCLMHWGDCALFENDAAKAVTLYERAIALNPNEYQAFFFKGDALYKLRRFMEARTAYVEALLLRPSHQVLVEHLLHLTQQLQATVHDEPLQPQAMAKTDGAGVRVAGDAESIHWMAYALCKALWLGEPSHREEMSGSREKRWSVLEERECLANLYATYSSNRTDGKVKREPALDRLADAFQAGFIDEFILYEIAPRIDPHITLVLEDSEKARVREYIQRFVLVPWPAMSESHD